jgi:uncharacterized OB-fold protein
MATYLDEVPCPSLTDEGTQCGNVVQRNKKFCSECGAKIKADWFRVKPPDPVDESVCDGRDETGKLCGQPLDPFVKFCQNCGARSWFTQTSVSWSDFARIAVRGTDK